MPITGFTPDSNQRALALALTACIIFNVLPIMDTSSLFDTQRDTILPGVVFLRTSGSLLLP